jgi:folate-binding protein YgfZ
MFDAALAHLQKFAVFSKVTLSEKTGWTALNYYGQEWPALPVSPPIHAKLSLTGISAYFLHWVLGPSDTIAAIQQALAKQAGLLELEQCKYLTVLANLVYIQPATRDLFIPQMIGLEKLGGVSFKKGCYVGQEVVARTQHLGQLKRHLQTIQLNTDPVPQIGEALFDEHKEVVGQIAAVSKDPQSGYRLLAVIQDRALSNPIFTAAGHPIR